MKKFYSGLIIFFFMFTAVGIQQAASQNPPLNHIQVLSSTLTGRLGFTFGDKQSGENHIIFSLSDENRQITNLEFGKILPVSWSHLLELRGRQVKVNGQWQITSRSDASLQEFLVQSISLVPGETHASLNLTGSQPWVTVLCKFNDYSTEPRPSAYFQEMYAPRVDNYWREQSYNLINLIGSGSVTRWFTLPHPRSYYVYDSDGDQAEELNLDRAANDCTAAADADVYYPFYVGINLMFNTDLDGYAWGGGNWMTLDGAPRLWYMTWEPPWGYTNLAVIEHEMGHGFGMPHSSGNYGQTYDNPWDIMSDTWTNCNQSSDPTYGCLGQHTISYHKDAITGWIPANKRFAANSGVQATITLERLAQPQSGDYLMAKIPIAGSLTHFYTVEARQRVGFDVKLIGNAVIIHEVDTDRSNPAHVIDGDMNGNNNDQGAMWTPGEIFTDPAHQIWVKVESATPNGYVITVSNQYMPITASPTATSTTTPTSKPSFTPTFTITATATVLIFTSTTTPTVTESPSRTATATSLNTRTATQTTTLTPILPLTKFFLFIPFSFLPGT
jgi:M6 family metalloprotease-like protein